MDNISNGLHHVLVSMGYTPDNIPPKVSHGMEHLLHLLETEDEEAVIRYYGLFGAERLSLDEIAAGCGQSPEDMMARIDRCIRKIAVTPEWGILKGELKQPAR